MGAGLSEDTDENTECSTPIETHDVQNGVGLPGLL